MKTIIVLAVLAISQFGVVYSIDYSCMMECQRTNGYGMCKRMCSY